MWKRLTYAQKTKWTLVAGLLLLLICWQGAFKRTWELRSKVLQLETTSGDSGELKLRIEMLEQRMVQASLLMSGTGDNKEPRQRLLNELSEQCRQSKILLKNMPGVRTREYAGYRVETQEFTIEGPFIPLLKLHHRLERELGGGRIASSSYRLRKDPKTRKDLLSATIYIHFLSRAAL